MERSRGIEVEHSELTLRILGLRPCCDVTCTSPQTYLTVAHFLEASIHKERLAEGRLFLEQLVEHAMLLDVSDMPCVGCTITTMDQASMVLAQTSLHGPTTWVALILLSQTRVCLANHQFCHFAPQYLG
jgi:hypothetical protein